MSASTRPPRQDPPKAHDRKARLAAALKVNIARRKAQVAARGADDTDGPGKGPDSGAEAVKDKGQ